MDEEETRNFRAALQFRQLAELNYQNNNFSDAFFHYVNCIKLRPEWKQELKERFLLLLCCLGQHYEREDQFAEIFALYEEAISLYNENEVIQHNLGAHLLSLGYPIKAACFFKESLKRNGRYFPAMRSLHSTFCTLVERWHYRMLNDENRNIAYKEVIKKKINSGFDIVLDLGTGTGLFSLYAAEAGAKQIYACDYNPTMISIAKNVFFHNALLLNNKVRLIEKHSKDIKIPNDIPSKVSLLVTETMDASMLGEHMLQSLLHAWKNLLLPSSNDSVENPVQNSNCAVVIPHSGSIWFCPISSNLLASKFLFPSSDSSVDECAESLSNICLKNDISTNNVKDLSFHNLKFFASLNEPYDTERLQFLPDYKIITNPQKLIHINFNNPRDIESFLSGNFSFFELPSYYDGYIHAIAVWFSVHLDDEISISSAPFDVNSKRSCWDQAIFPLFQAYRVLNGSAISLETLWKDGKLFFNVKHISHPINSIPSYSTIPIRAPQSIVSFLNDTTLINYLKFEALNFINKCQFQDTITIMDLYPIPIFGLYVILNAHLLRIKCKEIKLVYTFSNKEDHNVILSIAFYNNIPLESLISIWIGDFYEKLEEWPKSFDVILLDLINIDGDIREDTVTKINSFRPLLKSNGYLLPKKIQVRGQLIQSDYIEESMRVVNQDLHSYKISHTINEYQVRQMVELNIAKLPHEKFSDPFLCHELTIDNLNETFEKSFDVVAIKHGTCNSVLYWYQINLFNDESSYSTLNGFSYVNQAAYLFKTPISVTENGSVSLEFMYHHGALLIYKDFMQYLD